MTYSVHGRTHRLLRRLSEGDARFCHIIEAVHRGNLTPTRKRKLWRLVDVLHDRALIARDGGLFSILPAGDAELERLDEAAEHGGAKPSVRVFARAA